jgi:alkaline phosphatase D
VSNGVKAYREWMPIRDTPQQDPRWTYRSFKFGDLADLFMLEVRLQQ